MVVQPTGNPKRPLQYLAWREGLPLDYPTAQVTGSGANALKDPVGVAVGKGERVYVVDFSRRRISAFDRNGRFLFAFSKVNDGTYTELGNPVHIAMAPDNTLWVADRRNKAVYVFSADGNFLRRFLPNGPACPPACWRSFPACRAKICRRWWKTCWGAGCWSNRQAGCWGCLTTCCARRCCTA